MNELRVINGLHRGVSLPIDGDTLVVGSSLDADIALVDPGIAEQHIKVESTKKLPPGCWNMTVMNNETRDEEGKKLKGVVTVKLNKRYNIGGIWITFAKEDSPWPCGDIDFINQKDKPIKKMFDNGKFLVKAYSLAAGVLIGIITLTHAGNDTKANPPSRNSALEQTLDTSGYTSYELPQAEQYDESELLAIFKKMLKERNLKEVDVTIDDTEWALYGNLTQASLEKLNRMKIRFTKKHPNDISFINHIEILDKSLPFKIVKVVSGPMGHIEADDGHMLYIGNDYKGMKLAGITKDKILFTGKNTIEVEW